MADGFNILQKRIYELDDYEPLLPGEPGYEDPGQIYLTVDKTTWAEAKKISLLEFIMNIHKEQGPCDVTSVNVHEDFSFAFSSPDYYLKVEAYRIESRSYGDVIVNVPVKNLNKQLAYFEIELEEYTADTIVTYIAFE